LFFTTQKQLWIYGYNVCGIGTIGPTQYYESTPAPLKCCLQRKTD